MILFIDDEKRRMKSYIDELKLSEYEVEFKSNIDSAWQYFENNHKNIDLIILDIMMPPGKKFNDIKAKNGLRTGICFYDEIRNHRSDIPIIIFTNINIYDDEALKDMKSNDITLVCEKDNLTPQDLVKKIQIPLPSNC